MSVWLRRFKKAADMLAPEASMLQANSGTKGFIPKGGAVPGDDTYAEHVAQPTMAAIDQMPPIWRDLVHRYGYVDVYRAWKRGYSVADVTERAERDGGFFVL